MQSDSVDLTRRFLAQIGQNKSGITIRFNELLEELGMDRLDDERADDIARALDRQGIRCNPSPRAILKAHSKKVPFGGSEASSGYQCGLDDLAGVEITLNRDPLRAVHGALATTVIAAGVGFVGFWAYGLAAFLFGLLAVVIVMTKFSWLDGRLPLSWPRGRTLGVGVAAIFILVLTPFVYLPIRADHRADSKDAVAKKILENATAQIDAGDAAAAKASIREATSVSPGYAGIVPAAIELQSLQTAQAIADLDRKPFLYGQASKLIKQGKLAEAAPILNGLRGFRDVDETLGTKGKQLVLALQKHAERQLADGDRQGAAASATIAVQIAPSASLARSSRAIVDKANQPAK